MQDNQGIVSEWKELIDSAIAVDECVGHWTDFNGFAWTYAERTLMSFSYLRVLSHLVSKERRADILKALNYGTSNIEKWNEKSGRYEKLLNSDGAPQIGFSSTNNQELYQHYLKKSLERQARGLGIY